MTTWCSLSFVFNTLHLLANSFTKEKDLMQNIITLTAISNDALPFSCCEFNNSLKLFKHSERLDFNTDVDTLKLNYKWFYRQKTFHQMIPPNYSVEREHHFHIICDYQDYGSII